MTVTDLARLDADLQKLRDAGFNLLADQLAQGASPALAASFVRGIHEGIAQHAQDVLAHTADVSNEVATFVNATEMERLRQDAADAIAAAAPGAPQGKPFQMLLVVEGLESSDGRMLELGTTTWRDLPWPLMVQDTGAHGPGQTPAPAWAAGQVEDVYRDPEDASRIMGAGHLMPGEVGDRAENLARNAFRGVSIDGYSDSPLEPDVQPTVVDQNGDPLEVLIRFTDTVIHRVTMVPTPAFAPCCLWFDDEQMPETAAAAHGMHIDPEAAPQILEVENAYELLVASGGGPKNPPRDWFFTPEPDRRQEMILTADGHLTGHLVGFRECHTAYAEHCERVSESRTTPPFKGFHRTEAHCNDGTSVACGWIPLNTNHGGGRAVGWNNDETWEHYENSGTLAAKVRASNGKHGIWLSGAILPGLNDRELAILQGLSVSGHWYVYEDPQSGQKYGDELLAILGGVPSPGYPETRTRPELLVASGQIVGQIGMIECDDCDDCEETAMSATDVARLDKLERLVAALAGLADGNEEISAALAAAADLPAPVTAADAVCPSCGATLAADAKTCPSCGMKMAADVEDDAPAPIDVTVPLTAAENARYIGKYDRDARLAMASHRQARHNGTLPIDDLDDLTCAARSARTAADRRHVYANAARLDAAALLPADWQ